MEQHIPQEEIWRIIISDMVKKRNSIVPVIGEDAIVYSLGVPLVLLTLFYRLLIWSRSAFEECSMFIRSYTVVTGISD